MWDGTFNVKSEMATNPVQPQIMNPPPMQMLPQMLPPQPADPVITIFCGALTARLHLQYFQCPGIHTPCIEFDGEMITPKEFCLRANKDKQKDWKGSIRAGKRSLRYMMAQKAIEFYNHAEVCSGKCQSRNHVHNRTPKPYLKREIPVPTYTMRPPPMFPTYPYVMPPMQMAGGFSHMPQMMPPNNEHLHEGEMSPTMLAASCLGRGYTVADSEQQNTVSGRELMNFLDTNPLAFWNDVRRTNLMQEFLESISTSISNLCSVANDDAANLGSAAPSLSRLVHALNLQQYVINRVQGVTNNNNGTVEQNNQETANEQPQQQQGTNSLMMLGEGDEQEQSYAGVVTDEEQTEENSTKSRHSVKLEKQKKFMLDLDLE